MKPVKDQIYEFYHRQLKATAMADVLQARGFTPDEAQAFTLIEWQNLAAEAKVHEPHHQETIDLVVSMLKKREELKIKDPFEAFDE